MFMFWAWLRGLKWALRRAQNIFTPKNINCITIIITLEGCEKTAANTVMTFRFWLAAYKKSLYDYLILTFHLLVSAE